MLFLMEHILHRPICLVDILGDKKTHEIDDVINNIKRNKGKMIVAKLA
jgi:hypothetical protein